MIPFILQRREELKAHPETAGRAVETGGVGSDGNAAHLNRTRPLRWFKEPKKPEPKPRARRKPKVREKLVKPLKIIPPVIVEKTETDPLAIYKVPVFGRWIIKLAQAGNSAEIIAKVVDTSPETVVRVCEKFGVEVRQ